MEKLGSQQSVEWMMNRVGKVTASRFAHVMDKLKSGAPGAKRDGYLYEVVTERLSNQPTDHFVNRAMQDGIEREPFARMRYEAETGAIVEEVGFLPHPTMANVGGSPDGLIGADGMVEFKCPTPATHIRTLLDGMSADHLPQIQGLLWITGRAWCDFVSYYPDLPNPLDLHIQRVERDEDYIAELAAEVAMFDRDAEALIERLRPTAKAPAPKPAAEPAPQAADPAADDPYITPDQCANLETACQDAGLTLADLRAAAKVERLSLLRKDRYEGALKWIAKQAEA